MSLFVHNLIVDGPCRLKGCFDLSRRVAFAFLRNFRRDLNANVDRFQRFIAENDAKKSRAIQKAKMEEKARQHSEQKIEALKERWDKLKQEREELKKGLERYRRYELFLARVTESVANEFDEIEAVKKRYQILNAANDDLQQLMAQRNKDMDALRQKNQTTSRETQNRILVCNVRVVWCCTLPLKR